jgi:hypothetical protein
MDIRKNIFVKKMFYMNYKENWKFPKNVSSLTMQCENIHLKNLGGDMYSIQHYVIKFVSDLR